MLYCTVLYCSVLYCTVLLNYMLYTFLLQIVCFYGHTVQYCTLYFTFFLFTIFTSDDSDEPKGLVDHLPRRLLREHAEKRVRRRAPLNRERTENASDSDEDDVAIPEDPRKWGMTNPGLVGSRVPAFVPMAILWAV